MVKSQLSLYLMLRMKNTDFKQPLNCGYNRALQPTNRPSQTFKEAHAAEYLGAVIS